MREATAKTSSPNCEKLIMLPSPLTLAKPAGITALLKRKELGYGKPKKGGKNIA